MKFLALAGSSDGEVPWPQSSKKFQWLVAKPHLRWLR